MYKILFCGYYGFGNTGDEAIIQTITKEIRKELDDVNIKVMTSDVEYSKKDPYADGFIERSPVSILKAIKDSDLVIFGGGSIFQDVTSFKSIVYYSVICFLSRLFKKK